LYSVGLSIATLMFTGFFMNMLYPLFGISGPISLVPLVITISVVVLVLCILSYTKDKDFSDLSFIDVEDILSPSALILCLIPFLAIFGTYLYNYYNNNMLLLMLIFIISIIPAIVAFDRLPEEFYPFTIWIISISLLFYNTLSSVYLSNWGDASVEHNLANLVFSSGIWDGTIPATINSMLRVTMLHPIYSIMSDMSLTWEFKIVHPLLFSFTPPALYLAFKEGVNYKDSFLASFLFMSFFPFYTTLSRNTRNGIAIFFLSLVILLLVDKKVNRLNKSVLLTIFTFSLVFSHYATSYFFMICIIFAFLFVTLIKPFWKSNERLHLATSTYTLLYVVLTISWYIYTSSSKTFKTFVNFGIHFSHVIQNEFLSEESSYVVYATRMTWPISIQVTMYLVYLSMFLITIGILSQIFYIVNGNKIKFNYEFTIFSLITYAMLVPISLISIFNPSRTLQIVLCFLSPFGILGTEKVIGLLSNFFFGRKAPEGYYQKVFSVFLMISLLFGSGFISETLVGGEDHSPSAFIHKGRSLDISDPSFLGVFYRQYYLDYDVVSVNWLSKNRGDLIDDLYSIDSISGPLKIYGQDLETMNVRRMRNYIKKEDESYIYLRYHNYVGGKIIEVYPHSYATNLNFTKLNEFNKIYTNGGSVFYF
ncbi:MAG: DUF2206 domain-containing protein, partial [Thermotogota bacterium]|nr:DUF2206 domain-containing protein [Thermotogota bacterium]